MSIRNLILGSFLLFVYSGLGWSQTFVCSGTTAPAGSVTTSFFHSASCPGSGNNAKQLKDISGDAFNTVETGICDLPSEIPKGWVITEFDASSSCNGLDSYKLRNLHGAPTGFSAVTVCFQSTIPDRWVVTDTPTNSLCGSGTGNQRTILDLNGLALNTSKTVCSISPVPLPWVVTSSTNFQITQCGNFAGDAMTIQNQGSAGSTAKVQISTTTPPDKDSFVITDVNGNVLWSNEVALTQPTLVRVQNDGNVVQFQPRWATNTVQTANSTTGSPGCGGATLETGTSLTSGHCLNSASGRFVLAMQTDGNLVLYDDTPNPNPWIPLWSSGTSGHPGSYVAMQTDGNLVVYSSSNVALWWSGTSGTSGGYYLFLQDDGNVVVYQPFLWSTNTAQTPVTGTFAIPSCSTGDNANLARFLTSNVCAASLNGRFELLMQNDGNLVLFDLSHSPAVSLWSSGT